MNNPYSFDDSYDDDIFESVDDSSNDEHNLDGGICAICHVVHGFPGLFLNHLGDDPKKKLQRQMSKIDKEFLKTLTADNPSPFNARLVTGFINNLHTISNEGVELSLIRAMSEILNEISGGKMQELFAKYEAIRRISIIKQLHEDVVEINATAQSAITESNGTNKNVNVTQLKKDLNAIQMIMSIIEKKRIDAQKQYADVMNSIGEQIDEDVMNGEIPAHEGYNKIAFINQIKDNVDNYDLLNRQ